MSKYSPFSPESKAQDIAKIIRVLSSERFESHRALPSDSDELIFTRYQWNAEVCECFYAPLRVLEVVLRNKLDDAISHNFRNPKWLITKPAWLQENAQEAITDAHTYLTERNRDITQGRLVQEMSFGFWISLLNRSYEITLFRPIAAHAFPGMHKSMRTRDNVSRRFESIRNLRNRIFHFRRIWHRSNLQADFDQILEAIDWVNLDAQRLLLSPECKARFARLLAERP